MLEAGERIGRYRIEGQLGQGGMGSVYRARDEELGRLVAIKMVAEAQGVPSGSEGHARLLREARAAAALHHPNAVAIFDVGEHDGEPYIVMEYVDGESLRQHLSRGNPPWRQKLRWLIDVARALHAAHQEGLVHRDVKPDNIMVRADGSVKVVDFGIARRETTIDPQAPTAPSLGEDAIPTLTAEGVQVGTVHYMAPEQIRGAAIDGRTDQFAWAVCGYEVLAGVNPWMSSKTGLGVAAAILTDEPPALDRVAPEIPGSVARLVAKAMKKAPDERFANMKQIVDQLEGILDSPGAANSEEPSGVMRRYSSEQMRMVLERALAEPELGVGYSRSDVVEAAREVGADEAALQQALREIDQQQSKQQVVLPGEPGWWNDERRHATYRWVRHLLLYIVLNVFFLIFFGAPWWQRWLLFGWGLALAMQAINVVMPARKEDKKAKKRRRREEKLLPSGELSKAARVLVETTKLRRVRVQDDAQLDAEALAEAEPARARR